MIKRKVVVGILYGLIHFSVEVASFYFLFSRLNIGPYWFLYALIFDAFAFLPQSMIGIINDCFPKWNVGLSGALAMLISLMIPFDFIALLILSIGNAMVHVSGAQHTLRNTNGRITPNAVFVGGGSFGVITGQLLGMQENNFYVVIPLVLLSFCVTVMFMIHRKEDLSKQNSSFSITSRKSTDLLTLFAIITVMVRAYTAYAIPTEWNKTVLQSILLFVFMGIGKILGGILCDCLGYRRIAYVSLLGGLPLLLFGNSTMLLSLVGVALFSMTMPITIAILVSLYPRKPGFAFGLTTFALFLGSAPAFFIRPGTLLAHQVVVFCFTVVVLPLVIFSIKKGE